MSKNFHTLLVRVNPGQAKNLKMIAAFEDTSMSELVRQAIDGIVADRKKKRAYRELLAR